jgi:predicted metal-dependent phosphoesterase TrpH
MFKVDLHTHSQGSPDGGLTRGDYQRMLTSGKLDFIAVTDHDSIAFAQELHQDLGEQIIVGEEITTADGELIGLYLKEKIPAGLMAPEAAKAIHAQGGLVYVPHPFETVRKGLSLAVLEEIAPEVDIVETKNGRAVFQNRSEQTLAWSKKKQLPGAASSDAHGRHGWGKTFSVVSQVPTRDNLSGLLTKAEYHAGSPGLRGVMHPKINRLRKKLHV